MKKLKFAVFVILAICTWSCSNDDELFFDTPESSDVPVINGTPENMTKSGAFYNVNYDIGSSYATPIGVWISGTSEEGDPIVLSRGNSYQLLILGINTSSPASTFRCSIYSTTYGSTVGYPAFWGNALMLDALPIDTGDNFRIQFSTTISDEEPTIPRIFHFVIYNSITDHIFADFSFRTIIM